MDTTVLLVAGAVYLGMLLREIPGLALDRPARRVGSRPSDAAGGAGRPGSNLVSNVPAVMLLLPAAHHPLGGPVMALASTLAGNLLLVGSIANRIVVDQAARLGVPIPWRTHARVGVPLSLLTLAIAAGWLALGATW